MWYILEWPNVVSFLNSCGCGSFSSNQMHMVDIQGPACPWFQSKLPAEWLTSEWQTPTAEEYKLPGQELQEQQAIGLHGDKAMVGVAGNCWASSQPPRPQPFLSWSFVFFFSGVEQSRVVGAQTTGFTIAGQQPEEGLVIGVAALVDQRIGEVATVSPRPNKLSESVSGLRVVGISSRRIRVVWSPSYRATGYKVTWRHENGKKWHKLFWKCHHASDCSCFLASWPRGYGFGQMVSAHDC